MRAVRLCSRKHSTLDGIGASITGGRWNSPGKPVTYLASCGALAILEYLVHLKTLPKDMVLMFVEIPDTLEIQKTEWLPADSKAIRQIGDEWIVSKSTAILQVPSVLVPRQKNYLINPAHPLFGAIKILETTPFAFDSRILSSIPPAP